MESAVITPNITLCSHRCLRPTLAVGHLVLINYIGFTASTTGSSQTVSKATSSCTSHIREIYQSKGIPERTIPVLMNSWRASTKKQYDSHMKKWLEFLIRKSINVSDSLTITVVLEFITEHFDRGYS